MVDSHEYFSDLAARHGLSAATMARLKERGWHTQAGLAYSVLRQEDVDTGIVRPILGIPGDADPDRLSGTGHVEASALRRTFFECYSSVMVDLKRRAELTDSTDPRRLSRPEKSHMRDAFNSKSITGFKATGRLDPADSYLDRLAHMLDSDDFDLKYMEWERVSYQGAPVLKVSETSKNASGFWRETSRAESEPAAVTGQMSVYYLLHRRGVAFDMVGLAPFDVHEKLVSFYFEKMEQEPPSGYSRVSLDQVRLADKEVMREIQKATRRTGLRRATDGTYPVATALVEAMKCPAVYQILAPLPARSRTSDRTPKRTREDSGDEEDGSRARPKAKAKPKPKPKPKAVPRGVPEVLSSRLNPELLMVHPTKKKKFCFAFNLQGGCQDAPAGGECPRGLHLCPKAGCHQPHCYVVEHPEG